MCYVNFYNYLLLSGLAIAAYYLILCLIYYRNNLLQLFRVKRSIPASDTLTQAEDGTSFELASIIQAYLMQAGIEKMDRPQILSGLRQLLIRQAPVLSLELQEQLRPFIVSVCQRALGTGLSETELNFLWPAFT
jgi:hypothetical protein